MAVGAAVAVWVGVLDEDWLFPDGTGVAVGWSGGLGVAVAGGTGVGGRVGVGGGTV